MTCIIGMVESGEVYMGADSIVSIGDSEYDYGPTKIVAIGSMMVAECGSVRVGQLISWVDLPVPEGAALSALSGRELYSWLCTKWVPALRAKLEEAQSLRNKDGMASTNSAYLVGINGTLWYLASDFSLIEIPESRWHCAGNGEDVAWGAMHATRDSADCEARIMGALEAAAALKSGVGGALYVRKLSEGEAAS